MREPRLSIHGRVFSAWLICCLLVSTARGSIPPDAGNVFDGRGSAEEALSSLSALAENYEAVEDAEPQGVEVHENGWVLDKPDEGRPGESPSRPEQIRFWDKLQEGIFDDICRNIKLKVDQDFDFGDYGAVGAGVKRWFRRYPDKKIALVDYVKLEARLGYSEEIWRATDDIPFNIGVSAYTRGEAYVIRPVGGGGTCKKLKQLVNPMTFKTVVPMSAVRLSSMSVGELWKLPLEYGLRVAPSVGATIGNVGFWVSVGGSRSRRASVSLYRLSEDMLRLRMRIDRIFILDARGELRYTIPVEEWLALDEWHFTGGDNIVEEQLDKQVLKEILKYLRTAIGAAKWKREGRKVLLEFVFDPNDSGQMEKVAKFLKGNLSVLQTLATIAKSVEDPFFRDGSKTEYLEELEKKYASKLGEADKFAGVDDYDRKAKEFWFQLPILMRYDKDSGEETDRIVGDDRDVELIVHHAWKRKGTALFDIPFLGHWTKHSRQETVQTLVELDDKEYADKPMLVYMRHEGFMRENASSARRMASHPNALMRLAGTRGEGTNEDMVLPTESLFPKPEKKKRSRSGHPGRRRPRTTGEKTYRSAVTAFTLVLNENALQDILWTPAETIIRAYANSLEDKEDGEILRWVLKNSTLMPDGEIRHKRGVRRALEREFGSPHDSSSWGPMDTARRLSTQATKLVRDLVEARHGDWRQRTKALMRLISGKGRSDLAYEDMMKVLIQLVDPEDLFGEFSIHTNKKVKGEKDVSDRYLLNKRNNDPNLRRRTQMKERFAEPSLLVD